MEDMFKVGVITTTHGIMGEVKVFPTTNDARRFKRLKEVILDTGKELITLEVEGVKFFKSLVILKFKGIDNIDDVQKYRQKSLYVTRENAVRLGKDEYFIADLMGLKVVDENGHELGVLKEVMEIIKTLNKNKTNEETLINKNNMLIPPIKAPNIIL